MNEKLKSFFEKLKEDDKLRERFAAEKTAFDGYKAAKEYIEGVSFDEFKEGLTEIHNRIENRKKLLSGELRHISGGAENFAWLLEEISQFDGELF